ncbi:hypothetical protein [Mesorhizobium sp. ES1-4]|uniref:hypothetical protein n=1 Tax=Mesorhizobium sp. ES1-4 TaxID=2876627 RepID=UPI001CCBB2DB|nr:hypothetical protein [Mesorhizobium sp. ES1-4]MBZ9797895.1 hypothetical protein [Mesorhizobium sp. ES1-4]
MCAAAEVFHRSQDALKSPVKPFHVKTELGGIAAFPRFREREIGSTALLNSFLLLAEAIVYFSVMVTLFRVRTARTISAGI